MEKVKGLKEKAEFLLENNIRAFIKDQFNNFYFCDILVIGETHLLIQNFAGKREGEKEQLSWIDIELISEYREDSNTNERRVKNDKKNL
jgi:hypothetical protein